MDWNEAAELHADGHRLAPHDRLHDGAYALVTSQGHPHRERPPSLIYVSLRHHQEHHVLQVAGGQFLFELLAELDLAHIRFLVDLDGRVYGADYRVWRPLCLAAIDPAHWPPRLGSVLQGRGTFAEAAGLHDGHIWAVLTHLTSQSVTPIQLVHPCQAACLLGDLDFSTLRGLGLGLLHPMPFATQLACVFAANGHWALLWAFIHHGQFHWTYLDGLPDQLTSAARLLALKITELFDGEFIDFRTDCKLHQRAPTTCGTIALLHVCFQLGLCGLPSDEMILGLHEHLLSLVLSSDTPRVIGLGPHTVEGQLAALLVTKGVPWTVVSERAAAALLKLGSVAIQNALQQANPWGALKTLASRPGKTFQFVTKDELQAYVAQKAADKHGAQISTKKKQKKKPPQTSGPLQLDPSALSLLEGHFVDAEDEEVPQIQLSQVTADMRGIAICDLTQALPYIKDYTSLSADALALMITQEVPHDLKCLAALESLRFPATYLPTKDPMLIQGCLLQLGDVAVRRRANEEMQDEMEITTTTVLKIQIYRDEVQLAWDQFVSSPIKHLITLAPKLRLCPNPRCDNKCQFFHAPVEEPIDQVIHEIWARKFQSLEGRTLPADQAALFQAFLRVTSAAVEEILPSVVNGIYFEPRCATTKSTDNDYAVVWIPGATHEAAVHKLKTVSQGLGLVRMKQRYGIRVKAAHEETVYTQLRPGDNFVRVTINKIFRLHPLPHGLQRAQLAKLLQEWSWDAKPLQPSRGSADGGAWEVGASEDPPQPVLPAFGHDVLINLVKDKQQHDLPPAIIAPKRAHVHLRAQKPPVPTPTGDPWLQQDPWANFQPSSAAPGTTKRYDVLASQLRDDLTAQFQDKLNTTAPASSSAPSALEHRMQKMEVGLTELHAHNQQVGHWMKEAGARMAAQDEQIQQIHHGLAQQQADLVTVRTEVHSSASSLHQAMQTSFTTMKQEIVTDLASTLDNQMSKFETLLTAKKPRQE